MGWFPLYVDMFSMGGCFVRGNSRGEHRGYDRSPDAPATAPGPLDGFPCDLRRDVSTSPPTEGGSSEDPRPEQRPDSSLPDQVDSYF